MGISIREFQVTMETLKTKRLADCKGSRYNVLVPCFDVCGTEFYHSGSYYIVNQGKKVEDVIYKAMQELGEKHPGGDNFWWGEVHSIRGMVVLVLMLREVYNKEYMEELLDTIYERLLNNVLIKRNIAFSNEYSKHSEKMQELRSLLEEYSGLVNPFGNLDFGLNKPSKYLEKLKLQVITNNEISDKTFVRLSIINGQTDTLFRNDSEGWGYQSSVHIVDPKKVQGISFFHYYDTLKNTEMVYLDYDANRISIEDKRADINLRIDLKSGLAWKTYNEDRARIVTDKQLDAVIKYLKMSIEILKKDIIGYMVENKQCE